MLLTSISAKEYTERPPSSLFLALDVLRVSTQHIASLFRFGTMRIWVGTTPLSRCFGHCFEPFVRGSGSYQSYSEDHGQQFHRYCLVWEQNSCRGVAIIYSCLAPRHKQGALPPTVGTVLVQLEEVSSKPYSFHKQRQIFNTECVSPTVIFTSGDITPQ